MKQARFEFEELPCQTLSQFGLTREMIEDLPVRSLEEISHGRHSPVLPIRISDGNGGVIEERSRFALVRKENGEADVVFYPVLKKSPLEKYDSEQRKQLERGKVILTDIVSADGRKSKAFVQIDGATGQVMSVPTQIVARNLQLLQEKGKLSGAEIRVIQQGEPLTFVMEDEPVTIGIDLNERDCIRICQGDTRKWTEQAKREWDKYTFGCYGCWVMDDDGNLDYVPEEQYTEELWNEQKKSAQRNAGAGMHK
ncbi:MAG: DUF4099 domain-containing protein [Porphyromonadaceae bacterium]|nr:DUF4099 domain-containing protein [Porphyromonadaceae bacterium]